MSSSRGGKFQDHYALLDISATADREAIEAAFNRLATKYHPKTGSNPDTEKFNALSIAHEILADPGSREAFDQLRGNPQVEAPHRFSGQEFFDTLAGEPARRLAILCLLYDRARQRPTRPGLSVRQTEAILKMTGDDMRFAMAYLKQRGLAISDDKSNLLITVDGMDYVEKSNPEPAAILALLGDQTAPAVAEESAAISALASAVSDAQSINEAEREAEGLPISHATQESRTAPTASENLAARIRSRMAIPRPPATTT